MPNIYCFRHGRMTYAQYTPVGECHEFPIINELGQFEIDWCFYPTGMAYSEPEPYPEDYDEWLSSIGSEPTEEELKIMNDNSIGLMFDFGLLK